MTKAIVQIGDEVLRQTAHEVPLEEITSQKIKNVVANMKEALASQDDGVAIAAPQIGESLRIFVVSGKVFTREGEDLKPDETYINPVITNLSRKKENLEEGCLSVRGVFGSIERHEKAEVTAYNEKGEKFTRGGSGLLAQIFQHETDHLNGTLFVDHAHELIDVD